jgi:hypothetical protein
MLVALLVLVCASWVQRVVFYDAFSFEVECLLVSLCVILVFGVICVNVASFLGIFLGGDFDVGIRCNYWIVVFSNGDFNLF